MIRRALIFAVLGVALALPASSWASPVFVFSGRGFGHGVGMSQYGAYGFAQHGWTYDKILAHYYTGTELGPTPTKKIRVLLAAGRKSVEISSAAPFAASDAQGAVTLPAGTYRFGPDLALEVGGKARTFQSPITFKPGKSPLELGRPYRGAIVVSLSGGGLTVVNHVRLEAYLYGVVAREMPASWHPEALKAQAVAARSYALASRERGGLFDVYADTRSQVYGGIRAEQSRTTTAVKATKGQVVLYGKQVAWTFFHSTSGGKTATSTDVWPGAQPLPYLVSVDDPYDGISPYHRWGPLRFTTEELAAKLGSRLPAGLEDLAVDLNGSGRVSTVTATGSGETTKIPGGTIRALLGLRSTWFRIDKVKSGPSSRRSVAMDSAAGTSPPLPTGR